MNSKMSWSVTTISKLLQQHTGSAMGKPGEDGRKDGCECRNGETGRKTETGRRDLRRSKKEDGILTSHRKHC